MKTTGWAAAAALLGLVLGAAGCSTPPGPNVFDVGRVRVVMPSEGWSATALKSSTATISSPNGNDLDVGTFEAPHKAIKLARPDGSLAAILYVMASPGASVGGLGVVGQSSCGDPEPGEYMADLGGVPLHAQCVHAWNDAVVSDFLDDGAKLGLGAKVRAVSVSAMNTRASIVRVLALLPADFTAATGDARAEGPLPAGFPAGLATWADQLGRAAHRATVTLTGVLEVPPGNFGPAPR